MKSVGLDPEHIDYLRARGIHEDTAQRNKLSSLNSTALARLGLPGAQSGLLIPYRHSTYRRIRLFQPVVHNGVTSEFWAPPEHRIGKRCYLPAGIHMRLSDMSDPLVVAAGEIEALAIAQCGACAIGLAWPWWPSTSRHASGMQRSLAAIWRRGRSIYLVPAPEFWNCSDRQSQTAIQVHQFAYLLNKLDARVFLLGVPSRDNGAWMGIAEYLARGGRDARAAWSSLEPCEMHIPRGFPQPTVANPPRPSPPPTQNIPERVARILGGQSRKPPLRPGQDFQDGRLIIGVSVDRESLYLDSRGGCWDQEEADDHFRLPPVAFELPETFACQAIRRHLEGGRVKVADVIARVETLFRKHVYWRRDEEATALGLWTFGTYLFSVFPIYGYLWLTSALPRSGKSTVLRILSHIAFHASEMTVDTTPATLYRGVGYTCQTLILDELEDLYSGGQVSRKAIERLLNGGFERGNTVGRTETVNKVRQTVRYPLYVPKALAGISSLPETTLSRCFKIRMWRKKKEDAIERFKPQSPAVAVALTELRNDLYRAALLHAEEVARIYDRAEEFALPACDDRARDILEPLYAIAELIDRQRPAGAASMTTALCAFAQLQAGVRATQDQATDLAQVVLALAAAPCDKSGTVCLTPTEIQRVLESAGLPITSTKQVGQWLGKLGLVSAPHRVPGKGSARRYLVTRATLDDLKARIL